MAAFDWSSLIPKGIDLGVKAIGDAVAPSPELQNARTNAQTAQTSNEIAKARMANANAIRGIALPGIATQLGYNPSAGRAMAAGYSAGAPNSFSTPGVAPGASGAPGLGSTIGKTALGLAPAALPAIIGHAANAATGVASTGLGGLSNVGGLGIGGVLGMGAATLPILGGAALVADLIWKHTQAHPIADKWVQGVQNPFDAHYKQLAQSGLPPDQVKQAQYQSAQNYLNTLNYFSKQGGRNFEVAKNAARTFRQYYGEPAQYGVPLNF